MEDIGVFNRDVPLTPAQMEARQRLFQELQKKYNESPDKNLLWFEMAPLIRDSVEANVMRINHYGFILNYEEKVDVAFFSIMKRYVDNPKYNFGSLVTLGYYAALYSSRNEAIQDKDKLERLGWISYEYYIESTGNEIDYEPDFENYIDIEEFY